MFSSSIKVANFLDNLPVLFNLDLSGNSFGYIDGDLGYLRSDSLRSLDLADCDLHVLGDIFPASLSGLEELDLTGNPISVFNEGSLEFITGDFQSLS